MDYLAVGLAGFLGAVTRAVLGKLIKFEFAGQLPVNTLVINLTGCLVLSFFMRITVERLVINPRLRVAISTGFLGAYTTFSAFALETTNLIRGGSISVALAYAMATSFGCVLLSWAGVALSRLITETDKSRNDTSSED